jgi:chromosome segregation ATPase
MSRPLACLNLVGVLLLAALAIAQWQVNRSANLHAIELEKINQEQRLKISEQDRTIGGQAADLDTFREQLTRTHASLKESESRRAATEHEVRQISAQRDELRVSVTNWAAAVTARDEQLKLANAELRKIGAERNDVVGQFNELAAKYNSVVQDLNEARSRLAGTNAAATSATER